MELNSAIKTAELLIYTKTLINNIIIILGYVGTEMGVGKGAEGERDYKGT